ncbi:hypothetical protein [Streptomyces fractus]
MRGYLPPACTSAEVRGLAQRDGFNGRRAGAASTDADESSALR